MNSHCQPRSPQPLRPSSAPGDRRAEEGRDRDRDHEDPDDPRPVGRGEPVGQVEDHAREEAGLGDAQQEAQADERPGPLHEGHGGGDQPPGRHDPGDPEPRPEALQHQVAGDLHQEVAEEEDPRAPAEHRRPTGRHRGSSGSPRSRRSPGPGRRRSRRGSGTARAASRSGASPSVRARCRPGSLSSGLSSGVSSRAGRLWRDPVPDLPNPFATAASREALTAA